MEVINSKEATALYRTASALLLALISVCAFVAVGALGDLKELTVEVRRLNDRLASIVGELRVTDTTMKSLDTRLSYLEHWQRQQVYPPR